MLCISYCVDSLLQDVSHVRSQTQTLEMKHRQGSPGCFKGTPNLNCYIRQSCLCESAASSCSKNGRLYLTNAKKKCAKENNFRSSSTRSSTSLLIDTLR